MMKTFVAGFVLVLALLSALPAMAADEGAHRFEFTAIDGTALPLAGFANKAVLVVNTASFCGFTRQYEALQTLYERYQDQGLVVLGVPSNDFGNQEPGSEAEIQEFCEVNFNITFPLTEKNVVRGDAAHPFYQWALQEFGADAAPKWNFHKYLIGPDGAPVAWFPSMVRPDAEPLVTAVEAAIAPAEAETE